MICVFRNVLVTDYMSQKYSKIFRQHGLEVNLCIMGWPIHISEAHVALTLTIVLDPCNKSFIQSCHFPCHSATYEIHNGTVSLHV